MILTIASDIADTAQIYPLLTGIYPLTISEIFDIVRITHMPLCTRSREKSLKSITFDITLKYKDLKSNTNFKWYHL